MKGGEINHDITLTEEMANYMTEVTPGSYVAFKPEIANLLLETAKEAGAPNPKITSDYRSVYSRTDVLPPNPRALGKQYEGVEVFRITRPEYDARFPKHNVENPYKLYVRADTMSLLNTSQGAPFGDKPEMLAISVSHNFIDKVKKRMETSKTGGRKRKTRKHRSRKSKKTRKH